MCLLLFYRKVLRAHNEYSIKSKRSFRVTNRLQIYTILASIVMDASTSVSLLEAAYDYVVVGGGTAGLVVASRLSEDDQVKVIVLEAGDNHLTDPRINTPAGWSAVLGSEVDWSFKTSAQVMLHPPSHQNQVTDSTVA